MIGPSLSSCEHTLNTLRYADRVKELGLKQNSNNGGGTVEYEEDMGEFLDDDEGGRMEDGVLSPEDSDLAQLRSLNDGECSADWYNFQESVAHLQVCERGYYVLSRTIVTHKTFQNFDLLQLRIQNCKTILSICVQHFILCRGHQTETN
jgi:kinesin family protein 2/24